VNVSLTIIILLDVKICSIVFFFIENVANSTKDNHKGEITHFYYLV